MLHDFLNIGFAGLSQFRLYTTGREKGGAWFRVFQEIDILMCDEVNDQRNFPGRLFVLMIADMQSLEVEHRTVMSVVMTICHTISCRSSIITFLHANRSRDSSHHVSTTVSAQMSRLSLVDIHTPCPSATTGFGSTCKPPNLCLLFLFNNSWRLDLTTFQVVQTFTAIADKR